MVNPLPAPLPASRDAANRAARTFVQGLIVDVGGAILVAIAGNLSNVRWTRDYWMAFGLMLLKTLAISGVSYVYRLRKPPPGGSISTL